MNRRSVSLPFGIVKCPSASCGECDKHTTYREPTDVRHRGTPFMSDFPYEWLSESLGLSPQNMVLYKEMRSDFANLSRMSFFLRTTT